MIWKYRSDPSELIYFRALWLDEFERSQPVTSLDAVGSEVAAIDRKNLVQVLGLGHGDEPREGVAAKFAVPDASD